MCGERQNSETNKKIILNVTRVINDDRKVEFYQTHFDNVDMVNGIVFHIILNFGKYSF